MTRRPTTKAVRDELETLLEINAGDVISVETSNGLSVIRTKENVLSTAVEATHLPIAQNLTQLQSYTASVFVMPSITEITDDQFRYLSLLASIYGGTAHHWTWTEVEMQMPEGEAKAKPLRMAAVSAGAGTGHLAKTEAPEFQLGNRVYTVDHPATSISHSIRLDAGVDPTELRPGDTFRLIPGSDDGVTTSKVVDWTPGSIQFD